MDDININMESNSFIKQIKRSVSLNTRSAMLHSINRHSRLISNLINQLKKKKNIGRIEEVYCYK